MILQKKVKIKQIEAYILNNKKIHIMFKCEKDFGGLI